MRKTVATKRALGLSPSTRVLPPFGRKFAVAVVSVSFVHKRGYQLSHGAQIDFAARRPVCLLQHSLEQASQPHGVRCRRHVGAERGQTHYSRLILHIIQVRLQVIGANLFVPHEARLLTFAKAWVPLIHLVMEVLPKLYLLCFLRHGAGLGLVLSSSPRRDFRNWW